MCVQDTAPQSSEATAPPWLANQALSAAVWSSPSYSTESLEATVVMDGATVSTMVNVALVVDAFSEASFAVKVTVTAPVAPHKSLSDKEA